MLLLRWSLSSLSQVEGWHAPAGRRTREPRPLAQARQIRPAAPVGAVTWGPADRSSRKTARTASAESEVRPGPRLPTLRPYPAKTGKPGRKHYPHPPCRVCTCWGGGLVMASGARSTSSGTPVGLRQRPSAQVCQPPGGPPATARGFPALRQPMVTSDEFRAARSSHLPETKGRIWKP